MDPVVAGELRALVDADRPALHIARPFGSERLRRYLDGRLVTDAMVADAAGRGPRDRDDHAGQPLRRDPVVHRRGPEAVRDARQQRERRAPVRPPGAGRPPAARAAGAAPPPGLPRPAHRPRQPQPVRQPGEGRARRGVRARSRCCSSTWTTSRPSTTVRPRRRGRAAGRRRAAACATRCGPTTRSRGSAATSSP